MSFETVQASFTLTAPPVEQMMRTAVIDGEYRYRLDRAWAPDRGRAWHLFPDEERNGGTE